MKRSKSYHSKSASVDLAARIDKLNLRRQEIIRPAIEHPREYVLLSVRALAKKLQTDPATIVRIVRKMGFGSYRDFQFHLHERSLAFATSLDTLQSASGNGDMPDHVRESLERDMKNLVALKNSIDAKRLVSLAKRFYEARRIVVIANDLAVHLAEYLEYQTSLLGLPIFAGTSAGRSYHLVRPSTEKDIVIAISFRRGLRFTVEGVQTAHAKGAYCVGITDTYLSPLSPFCDEIFLASTDSTSLAASYAAPVALVNAIFAACAQHRRQQTLAIAREISEEQRTGSRWYRAAKNH